MSQCFHPKSRGYSASSSSTSTSGGGSGGGGGGGGSDWTYLFDLIIVDADKRRFFDGSLSREDAALSNALVSSGAEGVGGGQGSAGSNGTNSANGANEGSSKSSSSSSSSGGDVAAVRSNSNHRGNNADPRPVSLMPQQSVSAFYGEPPRPAKPFVIQRLDTAENGVVNIKETPPVTTVTDFELGGIFSVSGTGGVDVLQAFFDACPPVAPVMARGRSPSAWQRFKDAFQRSPSKASRELARHPGNPRFNSRLSISSAGGVSPSSSAGSLIPRSPRSPRSPKSPKSSPTLVSTSTLPNMRPMSGRDGCLEAEQGRKRSGTHGEGSSPQGVEEASKEGKGSEGLRGGA